MTSSVTESLLPDLFSVKGKVALVTGGSRGIGAMIAQGLVEAGAKVYISSRKAEACDATAAELSKYGECISLPADLSTDAGALGLAEQLKAREQRLDILVNNAGATWGAPLEDYPESAWDKLWSVNVKAPFRLTTELLPLLRAGATEVDPARVINIGSIDGLVVSSTENYAYGPSKAAIHYMTRQLAAHLAPEHITVNAIAPGPFHTKMLAFLLDTPEGNAQVVGHVPLRRTGLPSDAAGAVIFLSSRAGSYLTGVILPLDGGSTGAR